MSLSLDLGGYGAYVWPAYGIAAVVLLGLLIAALTALRENERALTHLQMPRATGQGAGRDPLAAEDGRGDGG